MSQTKLDPVSQTKLSPMSQTQLNTLSQIQLNTLSQTTLNTITVYQLATAYLLSLLNLISCLYLILFSLTCNLFKISLFLIVSNTFYVYKFFSEMYDHWVLFYEEKMFTMLDYVVFGFIFPLVFFF